MCILLAQKMCTFEILSPRIDIVNYLVPTWHVSSTSCNLLVFGVKMMSDILAIYHRELFPFTSCLDNWYSLLWQILLIIFTLAFAFYLPFLLPRFVSTPFVFHTTCGSCVFLDLVQCFLDIVKVVIPPCAFCIQMQILYNALVLGELSYFL